MLSRLAAGGVLLQAAALAGGLVSATDETSRLDPAWSISLQAGYANTFQLMLGSTFGEGSDLQNRLTANVNDLLRGGDSLTLFGWSTTDLPTQTPNWQAGISYKQRIFHRGRNSVFLAGGAQRWLFPNVKTGAKDWLATGGLSYNTSVGRLPITVSHDSWSLLTSTLPTGSLLYTQIQTQHAILTKRRYQLLLRHGPTHTYAWGFYGAHGNRVVRYNASIALAWSGTTLEVGCRQQFGLQDKIPYNRFLTVLVTRQLGGRFRPESRP